GLAEAGGPMVVHWPQRYFQDDLDESVAKVLDQWRRDMEAAGWRFCDGALPDAAALAHYNGIVLGREAADTHADALARHPERIGEQVRRRLEAGAAIDPAEYRAVLAARAVHRQQFLDAAFEFATIIATPLLRVATPTGQEAEADHPDRIASVLGEIGHNVRPFSYLGLPALVVPVGRDANGMPVAVQLVGRPGSEGELLRSGLAIERRVRFRKSSQSAASYL
ncbi:MAG: hypothetical protein J0H54_06480, partial [Rhizobiales bacterium]|nr:hypothetical protein [Hyphomicrobiales bacterium]